MDEQVFFNVPLVKLEPIFKRWMKEVQAEIAPKQIEVKPSGYITRAQICEVLHITLPTLHAWVKQGKLQSYHIGGRTLFKEAEVLAALKPVDYSIPKKPVKP